MSLLGHLDLPAGDPDLVQLTWADTTTFETVLGASSSVLVLVYESRAGVAPVVPGLSLIRDIPNQYIPSLQHMVAKLVGF